MVNKWTREDLPPIQELLDSWSGHGGFRALAVHVRDAVVDHLNAHCPKPTPGLLSSAADCVLDAEDRASAAKSEVALWRRAHEIVEGERDHARAERDEAERERNEMQHTAIKIAVERDKQQGRAEAAERSRDAWKARADAAKARTAPAVTRDDIEKAIRGKTWAANREPNKAGFHRVHIAWATDSVWSLVSGADPAVFVVRESDVAAVEVRLASDGWYADGAWLASADETAEWVRDRAAEMVVCAARNEAVARAIEQDAATDPLLDKAQEFAALADWELTDREAELLHTVARHVIGQEEVRHVDQ